MDIHPIEGGEVEVDIRYLGKKKSVRIRTTAYKNGDLYGRGKWIGETTRKIYYKLVIINFTNNSKQFILT